ncbi:TonB-dependent receptor [Sphingomonas profundi]|uniref:TonB-dependent receptor n=1 Tax=Alterirhizorhabdus profundi TaxID=2681549 RepID=UPI001E381267|nr:TonB-dependent receptor [Sphingomonas profundi]
MIRIFVSLTALLAATPAFAQSAAATGDTGAADDTIVVTASRSGDAVPANLIGSSVTVLDSQALESRQTRILSDILRDVPGVAVNRTGAVGGLTQIRIRGSEGNHVLVFIDGIKASDPYYGEYDFGNLIADENARVEVLRGQQSSLYGSDAIGGVITYTTLSGREAPGITARAEGGSFGTFSTAGRVAGTVGDDLDYAVSGTYLTTDGYATAPAGSRDLGSDNLGTSAKLNWSPAPNLKITAVARYSYTKADLNDQGIDASSPRVLGYPVQTVIDTPGSDYRNKALYGLVRAELNLFDDALTTALSGQITDANRDAYDASGYSYGDRGRRYRGSFENTVRFGSERVRNRFTFAVDAEREESRNIDPSGFAFTGTNRIDTIGFVAQYDVTVDDRLALGASARIDDNDRFGDATTVRVNGSYLFDTGTRVHAAYGNGVKAPTMGELFGYSTGQYIGNPALSPERSRGWEAGVEQSLLDGGLRFGATYFRSRFFDQIQTVGTVANGQFISTSINNDVVARQRGVEAYANARIGDWRVDASYTYLKAPQVVAALVAPAPAGGGFQAAVPVETQAVRRPRSIASFNLSYAPEATPFTATLTVRYNGRQRDYAFNSRFQRLLVDLRAFTLVNLNATYDISRTLQLFGRVENLFDRDYQEVFTFATPGRAAYGGVRVRL